MGTESVASLKRNPRDIRQKVINYQEYFRNNRYNRYEKYWDCNLKGFRLLFLTNTNSRLVVLSRLVQEMPPSRFIWLTSLEQMFSHGLSAEIWTRAGKQEAPSESILGPSACRTPVMPLNRKSSPPFRNMDAITFASRRIDLGQVRSLRLPVRYGITKAEVCRYFNVFVISYRAKMA